MINTILGTKIDQGQTFDSKGDRLSVTRILAGPCTIVGIKTMDTDGYDAIKVGIGTRRPITLTKPELGVFKKAGLDKNPPRFLKEIRMDNGLKPSGTDAGEITQKIGDSIKVADVFKAGDIIQVTGISKGKGFAGVVKRHHFRGGPRTHGQSDRERAPGAIGSTTTPGRVYKGKRMAGRMGQDKTTIKNLKVISVDIEKNILTVSGLLPGGRNSLLVIKKLNN